MKETHFHANGQAPGILLPRQKKILDALLQGKNDLDEIARTISTKREDLMRDIEELKARGLIEVQREEREITVLTEEAKRYLETGLPEERLARLLQKTGILK
ncbi:MAG: hypothetical protein LM573_01830, partial [Thermofilum sp.]|nr:hypothetical protein [Thermofilum sp.]